jgi:NTP pyrophosphatase (non-canonical NTP hydrolase)
MSKSKRYYLYHVKGLKIGVTSNVKRRVEEEQGFAPDEYEILASSADKEIISRMEFDQQRKFGYSTDRESYAQATRPKQPYAGDKPNVTDQTVTFPCPIVKLDGWMRSKLPLSITIPNKGIALVTLENLNEVMDLVQTSQWRKERCYIYNNKLYAACQNQTVQGSNDFMSMTVNEPSYAYDYQSPKATATCNKCIFPKIREWAKERGIFDKGDAKTQYVKLMEEAGEVARAILKKDIPEIKDGIGDMVVVLTNLAHLSGLTIEECIESAYDVISKRQGAMVNGSFVKNETL